jgi:hypothetical protein
VNHICPHGRQLFEGGGRLQQHDGHLLAIPFSPHDLNDATPDEVQCRAGFPLFKDVLAIPVGPFVDDLGELSEVPPA